jgi:hypothetical protein
MLLAMRYALCSMRRAQHLVFLLTLVALGLLLFTGTGRAQTKGTFTPRVSVSETYDDNIDLEPHDKNSDWITVVSPGLNFQLESQHTQLALDLAAGLSFYLQESSNDTVRYTGSLSWDQQVAQHLSLHVSDALTRSEDPITEEDGRITDISQGREVQYRNTGEASTSWQFGAEDLVTLGYRNRLLNSNSSQTEDIRANEGFLDLETWLVPQFGIGTKTRINRSNFQQPRGFIGEPTDDFYQYETGITLNYRWKPTHVVYASYYFLFQDFTDRGAATDTDDYGLHEGGLGLIVPLGSNTTFDAEGGYFYQDFQNGGSRDGPTFRANLATTQERSSFSISGSGGYDQDYYSSENLGSSEFYDASGTATYMLTENFRTFADASYRWEKFYGDDDTSDRRDKTWLVSGGLGYTLRDWLTLSLEGTHLRRDSTDNDQEFTDNRVMLLITASYPIPIYGE